MARFSTRMRSERLSIALAAVHSRRPPGCPMTGVVQRTPAVERPDAKVSPRHALEPIAPLSLLCRSDQGLPHDARRRGSFHL
jgi:hypothetical protein